MNPTYYIEDGQYKVDGDPTEAALIVSAMKSGLNPEEEREHYPQLFIIPFESERGYMATLHRLGDRHLIFVKGAPEKLLDICQECRFSEWENVPGVADHFAKEGLRVLGLAYKEVPVHQTEITMADLQTGLIFAGLQGMIDPPRPEAVDAVAGCKKAGIRVVMITGDHAITAGAIAKKVGIVEEEEVVEDLAAKPVEAMTDEELFTVTKELANVLAQHAGLDSRTPLGLTGKHVQALADMEIFAFLKEVLAALVKRAGPEGAVRHVLTGRELETMSDAALFHLVQKVSVYARVAPHHKLRITQQLT